VCLLVPGVSAADDGPCRWTRPRSPRARADTGALAGGTSGDGWINYDDEIWVRARFIDGDGGIREVPSNIIHGYF
jgi:hypothetical protein